MTGRSRLTLAVLTAIACATAVAPQTRAGAQSPAPDDVFRPIAGLIGRWQGRSEGQPGAGTVTREYERSPDFPFIRVRNTSRYEPQPKNPKGEVHHDEGFFSFDKARKRLVLRQFHREGFVNQYVQEPDAVAGRVVFTSESIENIPAGWRARETYVIHGPDAFEEIFELAEPNKDFEVYSRSRFTRSTP